MALAIRPCETNHPLGKRPQIVPPSCPKGTVGRTLGSGTMLEARSEAPVPGARYPLQLRIAIDAQLVPE